MTREQLAAKIYERVGVLQTLEPDYCRWEYLDEGQKAEALAVLDIYIDELTQADVLHFIGGRLR